MQEFEFQMLVDFMGNNSCSTIPVVVYFPVYVVWNFYEYRELAYKLAVSEIIIDHNFPKVCSVLVESVDEYKELERLTEKALNTCKSI